jgi:hypothetical protein
MLLHFESLRQITVSRIGFGGQIQGTLVAIRIAENTADGSKGG